MAEENKDVVKLHGFWASPFSKRVELALKLKGIPYEYVEEDLMNKSPLLLQYNPVHKNVPLFFHNGNPIAESLIILEYIDETWKHGPPLLPHDPFKRAQVRFWATFFQEELFDYIITIIKSEGKGEVQQKALEGLYERLSGVENGMKGFFKDGIPEVDSNSLGLLDIIIWSTFMSHKSLEQVFGIKFLDPERFPLLFSWVNALNKVALVKETTPPHEEVVRLHQFVKQGGKVSNRV